MLPMSSSSSHNATHRRNKPYSYPGRGNANGSGNGSPGASRRPPIARSKSLLGAIKNIVTAPLSWFANTDDFEDTRGKRRRLVHPPIQASTRLNSEDQEDGGIAPRIKRLRVHSPDRQIQPQVQPGYLDPPTTVFQQQPQQIQPNYLSSNPPNRSASVTIPPTTIPDNSHNSYGRHTLSPLRASHSRHALSRTMSIDPPALSRDASMNAIPPSLPSPRDTSMEPFSQSQSQFLRPTIPRDLSMPPHNPLSARPSFRMRTSMTPQPNPHPTSALRRDASEPPPLTSLMSNPVFVRGPPSETTAHRESPAVATLGSLVDSQRSTRSPIRHHSSLLFGSQPSDTPTSASTRPQNPAEKALHELDVYKTPLVPTRLRANAPASTATTSGRIPDMFKRRSSHLVLMSHDDRKGKGKGKKSEKNDTKPYAGEGGMKKLLARRKQEVEEEGSGSRGDDDMDDGKKHKAKQEVEVQTEDGNDMDTGSSAPKKPDSIPVPPPPPANDWFTTASSTTSTSSSSSLRVGRTKNSRNHIVRPTASASRPKNKFSAAYEDDDSMDGDAGDSGNGEGGDGAERRKELQMLEEAAKHVPVFEIPTGFSFAKETAPIKHDATNAKEPPMPSLPFSFTKSSSTPTPPPIAPATAEPAQQSASAFSFGAPASNNTAPSSVSAFPSTSLSAPEQPKLAPSPSLAPASAGEPLKITISNTPASSNGIPNFFATSSAFSKPLSVPSAPLPTPSLPPAPTPTPAQPSFSFGPKPTAPTPVKDTENPLWEGENKPARTGGSEAGAKQGLFGVFGNTSGNSSGTSLFGGPTTSVFGASSAPPSTSVFGAAKEPEPVTPSLFGGPPKVAEPVSAPAQSAFSFGKPAETTPQPSALFGSTVPKVETEQPPKPPSLFGAPSLFGGTPASTGAPEAVKSPPFLFGQPAPPVPDPPKPIFGSSGGGTSGSGFSFGQPTSAEPKADPSSASSSKSPFSFGAAPSTPPPAAEKKSSLFGFSAPQPVSTGFSFGGGGSNASEVSSKPFTFGTPTSVAPSARPVTPPKIVEEQEVRMEESPTRDMQLNGKPPEARPSLGGGGGSGFSFGSSGSLFGQGGGSTSTQGGASGSSPFSFAPSTSNVFGAPKAGDVTPVDNKPFSGGGFGQTQAQQVPGSGSGTGFTFGQSKPAENDPPRPSTTGSFSFQPTPTSATGPSFSFGGGSSNPFGSQQSGSAPSSPSTFNQPSPFSFAPSSQSNPSSSAFTFGSSQPASPAAGSVSLPQPPTPGGFGSGGTGGGFGSGSAQPTSPFSATPAGGSPSLFTIGAAPAPAPGNRQIRKLPNRRAGKR